jgi:hypothetical protein
MSTARKMAAQLVHYLRFTVNFNDPGIGAGAKKQTLPAGAVIIGTDVMTTVAFNGATPALTVGTEAGTFANIVGAGAAVEVAGLVQNIPPSGAALGPLAADAQVGVLFAGAGATTGKAIVIIKYVVDNDL